MEKEELDLEKLETRLKETVSYLAAFEFSYSIKSRTVNSYLFSQFIPGLTSLDNDFIDYFSHVTSSFRVLQSKDQMFFLSYQ